MTSDSCPRDRRLPPASRAEEGPHHGAPPLLAFADGRWSVTSLADRRDVRLVEDEVVRLQNELGSLCKAHLAEVAHDRNEIERDAARAEEGGRIPPGDGRF